MSVGIVPAIARYIPMDDFNDLVDVINEMHGGGVSVGNPTEHDILVMKNLIKEKK